MSFSKRKNRQNGEKRQPTSQNFTGRTQAKREKILKNQQNSIFQRKIDIFVDFGTGDGAAVAFVSGNGRGGRESENSRGIDKMVEN